MTNIRKILIISINFLLYIVVLDPHHILRYILFSFKQVYENSQLEELQVTTMVKARFCIFFFFFLLSGFHFLLCLVQILGIIHATVYVPWNTGSFTMIPTKMIISISNELLIERDWTYPVNGPSLGHISCLDGFKELLWCCGHWGIWKKIIVHPSWFLYVTGCYNCCWMTWYAIGY